MRKHLAEIIFSATSCDVLELQYTMPESSCQGNFSIFLYNFPRLPDIPFSLCFFYILWLWSLSRKPGSSFLGQMYSDNFADRQNAFSVSAYSFPFPFIVRKKRFSDSFIAVGKPLKQCQKTIRKDSGRPSGSSRLTGCYHKGTTTRHWIQSGPGSFHRYPSRKTRLQRDLQSTERKAPPGLPGPRRQSYSSRTGPEGARPDQARW